MRGYRGEPGHGIPGPNAPVQLSMSLALTPPSIDGLTVSGGLLELKGVGVFGDVPADARTLVGLVSFALPKDSGNIPFPDAPYGLYSRASANIDDVAIQGTWRGKPLVVAFEAEYLAVDLRASAIEYSPTQGAKLAVQIDMNAWFDPAALDAVESDDGVLRIDAHDNEGLAADMARAIQRSFTLTTSANTLATSTTF